jgi:hypothetical protein
MPPKELLTLLQRMRAKRAGPDEIADVLAENGFSSESELRAQITQEDRRARNATVSTGNIARSAVQGATLGAAGKFGVVDEQAANQFGDAHPILDGAAQLTGAIVPSLLTGGAADALVAGRFGLQGGARIAAGGGLAGAAEGAAYNAINAPEGERWGAAGAGALLGGVAGALAPSAVNLVARGMNPSLVAKDRLRAAIENSMGGRDAVVEAARAAQRAGRGDVVRMADLSPRLRSELDFAANANPDVRARVLQELGLRRADRPTRMINDAKQLMGTPLPSAGNDIAGVEAARQQWANQAYGSMRSANQVMPLDDELRSIIERPEVTQAFTRAGDTPIIAGGARPQPLSVGRLHEVKKQIAAMANAAFEKEGRGDRGAALKQAATDLDQYIASRVPEYRALNDQYRNFKTVEETLQQTQDWWRSSDVGAIRTAFNNLRRIPDRGTRTVALEAARRGIAAQWVEDLSQMKAGQMSKINDILERSEAFDTKLRIAFGNKATLNRYLQRARVELEMARTDNVTGNSMTAFRQANESYNPTEAAGQVMRGDIGGAAGGLVKEAFGRGLRQKTAANLAHPLMRQGTTGILEQLDAMLPSRRNGVMTGAGGALSAQGLMSMFQR